MTSDIARTSTRQMSTTEETPGLASLPPRPPKETHPLVISQMASDVLAFLIFWRILNAIFVRTFFQPDEYFQSLEPAWEMAFGSQSGAWITWEWHNQLRSSLHPALFAAVYYVLDKPMEYLGFYPQFRAMVLTFAPSLVQSLFAAATDYFTWTLAKKIWGEESRIAWAALLMTIFSPWQWFCSTRTFSNSLETTLTIAALCYWPWDMSLGAVEERNNDKTSDSARVLDSAESIKSLRVSLLLSATACILRPTNGLIWFSILMPAVTQLLNPAAVSRTLIQDYLILVREVMLCGSAILAVSALSDYAYFGEWTFPPYQWLNFNISQDLAVFYGRNDWHYYLSQGIPLLTTTYLPFTIAGIYQAVSLPAGSHPSQPIRFLLATTILTTIASLSLISHKEVRFIYPLLPLLHILTAPTITSFFTTTSTITTHPPPFPSTPRTTITTITGRKPLLTLLLLLNVALAAYTTLIHQRGVLSVLKYLRTEYEALALDNRGIPLSSPTAQRDHAAWNLLPYKHSDYSDSETFAAFLMPCHSTPWRSQLVHAGLKAWALTCEPPIHLAPGSPARDLYRDEADRFYDDPAGFLAREVSTRERPWPRFVVGFEGIEGVLREYYEGAMQGWVVREKWRTGNSQWHDDARRTGDVVVWEFVDGSKV